MHVIIVTVVTCLIFVPRNAFSMKMSWSFLGPFLIGKTEVDVDPIEAFKNRGCDRRLILRKSKACPTTFLSEISGNAYVGWYKPKVSLSEGKTSVVIQFPSTQSPVDYNELVRSLNKMTVLEFQGWATAVFNIKLEGIYEVHISGAHSFYLDDELYAGDIYSHNIGFNTVYLARGKHYLDLKIRGKGQAQFASSIRYVGPRDLHKSDMLRLMSMLRDNKMSDIVDGLLPFNGTSWMQLPMSNVSPETISDIEFNIVKTSGAGNSYKVPNIVAAPDQPATVIRSIVPFHTQLFAFAFQIDGDSPARSSSTWWESFTSGDNPCVSFDIKATGLVNGSLRIESNTVTVHLQCRRSSQSFLFTFLDHDGSVSHAAALSPSALTSSPSSHTSRSTAAARPRSIFSSAPASATLAKGEYDVVLSLSGVGVTARSQADAHKFKTQARDKDYTFGFERAWVLAPARNGAHNWEGTGYLTALAALDYLIQATEGTVAATASSHKVVVTGHSRGGHGALTVATHVPDRISSVVTASGYADRENYGDANILFDVDLQLAYMDSFLHAIHLATIQENDNLQSAGNLKGIDVLVRSGSADRTVSPFFQRAIARVLEADGVNVSLSEKSGADHWYWDFDQPEDGGVVFDPLTRRFIMSHFTRTNENDEGRKSIDAFFISSFNPAVYGSLNGLLILQMVSRLKKSTIDVVRTKTGRCSWRLRPSNVRQFRIQVEFWKILCDENVSEFGVIEVGVSSFSFDRRIGVDICKQTEASSWQVCDADKMTPPQRKRTDYGPARQVMHSPFIIVVATGANGPVPSASLLSAARYLSLGNLLASGTIAPVVMDTQLIERDGVHVSPDYLKLVNEGFNFVLLGGPQINLVTAYLSSKLKDRNISLPIKILDDASYQLGGCTFGPDEFDKSPDYGVMFTFPLPLPSPANAYALAGSDGSETCRDVAMDRNRLGMVISARSVDSLHDVIAFSFSSNAALTRAPYSNLYADFFATGPRYRSRGLGGLEAVGFWDNEWRFDPAQGAILTRGDCY